jgi:GT2 family glycosyltransferase
MKVTIGIKAFNEETHIAASLASAVKATQPFGGEVILADSVSTDHTVEIAQQFPVRIVQLVNGADRSCGAGAQLAFQHARGEYFYLLDGDMVLHGEFLAAAIKYLDQHHDIAGVGGYVCEKNMTGEEFQIRATSQQKKRSRLPGIVDRLEGGGLYRAAAIREVGYFADRNLHGFEEFDLAARLQTRGWKFARIDLIAADHYGYTSGGYRLLWNRLRSGYAQGSGEVLRAAFAGGHLTTVLRRHSHTWNCLTVVLWWLLLIASLLAWPFACLGLLLVPFLLLSFRRGSVKLGLYSLTVWNVIALGLLSGFLRRRVPAALPLASVELVPSEESDIAAAQC